MCAMDGKDEWMMDGKHECNHVWKTLMGQWMENMNMMDGKYEWNQFMKSTNAILKREQIHEQSFLNPETNAVNRMCKNF